MSGASAPAPAPVATARQRYAAQPASDKLGAGVTVCVRRAMTTADPGVPGPLVKLVKTGAKVVRHARCVTFPMADVVEPLKVLAAILGQIRKWFAKTRDGSIAGCV